MNLHVFDEKNNKWIRTKEFTEKAASINRAILPDKLRNSDIKFFRLDNKERERALDTVRVINKRISSGVFPKKDIVYCSNFTSDLYILVSEIFRVASANYYSVNYVTSQEIIDAFFDKNLVDYTSYKLSSFDFLAVYIKADYNTKNQSFIIKNLIERRALMNKYTIILIKELSAIQKLHSHDLFNMIRDKDSYMYIHF